MNLRLRELQDALQVARRLSLKTVGWEQLQAKDADGNASGPQPYTEAAIATFTRALDQNEDDPDLLHHLAITHHARAWDLELQGSAEAFAAWEEALKYWRRLQTCAPFWHRLREKGKLLDPHFDPAILDETRQQLSQYLLEVHLDFIRQYYDQGQVERAEHHVRLVRRAHLPPAVRKQMDHRLYEVMTSGIPVALSTHDHATAIQVVERFLRLFPQYLPALQQGIEIYAQWLAQTSVQDQWPQIEALQTQAKPYATRLAAHPDLSNQPLARVAVAALAFLIGDKYEDRARALRAQRKQDADTLDHAAAQRERQTWDNAITWLRLAREHDPGRPQLSNTLTRCYTSRANLLMTLGMDTEDSSVRDRFLSAAFTDCQRILEVTPDHSDALFLGAQTLMLQKRHAEAVQWAERQVAVARQENDPEALHSAQALLSRLRVRPLADEALSHMRNQRFAAALPLLDQVIQIAPEGLHFYLRRAECHLELNNLEAAEADYHHAQGLAHTDDERESVNELHTALDDMRERIQQFSSLAVYRLQQEAVQAFNDDRYDEAITKLRSAIAQISSAPGGSKLRNWFSREVNVPKQKMAKELSVCLNSRAVQTMEHVMETFQRHSYWSSELLRSLQQAETDLHEATRLDPDDTTIKQNLGQVQQMLTFARSSSRR
ncbi:MAG: tetratricopeptide repeat protein [Deltaproteobacteria bacterium]|nr:tetratricopeptide repeat protein [Deltaproteobacteria bacterium]